MRAGHYCGSIASPHNGDSDSDGACKAIRDDILECGEKMLE
jgi:hypothetical protein